MIEQKGTILKIKRNMAIIMTSDCRIISIRVQPGMDVGMEVAFNKREIVSQKNKFVFPVKIAAGVAAVFVVAFIIFNSSVKNGVYAYVTIDSDTSIEFEVNKNNKIVKVNTFDNNANYLLKDMDLKNRPIDVAIKEVIEKTGKKDSTILISACMKEENQKDNDTAKSKQKEFNLLIDACKSAVENDEYGDIQSKIVEIPYTYKKLADINNISMGRSIVYEKAKEQGIDLDIEEIKNKSIGEALKRISIDDVGIVHDVKKTPKPADEPKPKAEPKDVLADKNEPKPVEEPKDKIKEVTESIVKQELEVKPDTDVKPKQEIKAEPDKKTYTPLKKVTETKPETGTKPEAELKTELKPEPEKIPEKIIETEAKQVPKPETEPKDENEPKQEHEIKPEPKIDVKLDSGSKIPDPQAIENKESEPKPEPELKLETDKKIESNIKIEPKTEPEIKPDVVPKPQATPKVEMKLEKNIKSKLEVEEKANPEVKADLETKPEPVPKVESDVKPVPKPE
ncbi:MAG TPA: anti-sigma factor domain-containing protein [Acetivibrio clariflavus]|nr:anti-sigma factor domain-containing protein [Acetivibrio clariflavus]